MDEISRMCVKVVVLLLLLLNSGTHIDLFGIRRGFGGSSRDMRLRLIKTLKIKIKT